MIIGVMPLRSTRRLHKGMGTAAHRLLVATARNRTLLYGVERVTAGTHLAGRSPRGTSALMRVRLEQESGSRYAAYRSIIGTEQTLGGLLGGLSHEQMRSWVLPAQPPSVQPQHQTWCKSWPVVEVRVHGRAAPGRPWHGCLFSRKSQRACQGFGSLPPPPQPS